MRVSKGIGTFLHARDCLLHFLSGAINNDTFRVAFIQRRTKRNRIRQRNENYADENGCTTVHINSVRNVWQHCLPSLPPTSAAASVVAHLFDLPDKTATAACVHTRFCLRSYPTLPLVLPNLAFQIRTYRSYDAYLATMAQSARHITAPCRVLPRSVK